MTEAIILRAGRGGARGGNRNDFGGDDAWADRMRNAINGLPPDERQDATEQLNNEIKFRKDVQALPPEQRRQKMMQHFAERMIYGERLSRLSPVKRAAVFKRMVGLRQAAKAARNEFSMKSFFFRQRRRIAFTIVELLVVIAIIALLSSLALPNFQLVMLKAQSTKCAEQLHGIGTAVLSYATDNNALLPEINQAAAPVYGPNVPGIVGVLGSYGGNDEHHPMSCGHEHGRLEQL